VSLAYARRPDGTPLALPGAAPFPADVLAALDGIDFTLPADDPWVLARGGAEHGYVDAAADAWDTDPAYMDVLDPDSPVYDLKAVERGLYEHHWGRWLDAAGTVLDVGCGVGRFLVPLVARGATVWGVDADLRSLRRCAHHAAGLPGRVDLSWSSVHRLPDVTVDAAIACEVLCYVPDAVGALRAIAARVRPGGAMLLSVEARWGWALAPDATPGTIAHALVGDGVIDVPGEGWVQTYEEDDVARLCEAAGLRVEALVPTHYVLDGPLEHVAGGIPELDGLLDLEEACRAHPVWRPLNRIWTAVAVR
jgi:2-polyprenyl-6-hydroxyphenyl methylase/3-demethylubiquinone-9 3-methyltransferase